jgi:hypothetical protein
MGDQQRDVGPVLPQGRTAQLDAREAIEEVRAHSFFENAFSRSLVDRREPWLFEYDRAKEG